MGELVLYGWASGVLLASDARNLPLLAVLIGAKERTVYRLRPKRKTACP